MVGLALERHFQADLFRRGQLEGILLRVGAGGVEDLLRVLFLALEDAVGHGQARGDGGDHGAGRGLLQFGHLVGGPIESAAPSATAAAKPAEGAGGVGVGHGGELLEVRDGHYGERAVLGGVLFGGQKIGTGFTQRIRRRAGTSGGRGSGIGCGGGRRGIGATTSAATPAARTRACLLRGEFGGQSGDDDDLALHVETFVGIDFGLVNDVTVAGEDQIAGDIERFERRGSAAAGVDAPILGVFEIRGARCRGGRSASRPATTTSAATPSAPEGSGRRCNRRLAIARHYLLADELKRHEEGLQGTSGLLGTASRFESPLGEVAGHVERRGIETARREVAAFELVGRQKVEINLHLFFADRVHVAVDDRRTDAGLSGEFRLGLRMDRANAHQNGEGQRGQKSTAQELPAHRTNSTERR